eukprot:3298377-Amphidinium_carterae.1
MAELMSDSRLMQLVDVFATIFGQIAEKRKYLAHLSAAFWQTLAAFVNKPFSVVSEYPVATLAALAELRSCTSYYTEKQHAATSLVRRQCRNYGLLASPADQ